MLIVHSLIRYRPYQLDPRRQVRSEMPQYASRSRLQATIATEKSSIPPKRQFLEQIIEVDVSMQGGSAQ
ncbi:MAG: hypothetical protein EZS28_004549 [Streblomastix strix]|uniref:Uncharacterized protein n=1 Tax=Streblomastix strix TaxID=222440 RepID=A0A5J4WYJ0_9EUKA|nr:MAG: hypothetical protein EZS28_004549 [Streblomastix strix]